MRALITSVVWIAYLVMFNLYLFELTHGLSHRRGILMYSYITMGAIIFYLIDRSGGLVTDLHKEFNTLLILSVINNFVLIILTQHLIIRNAEQMFYMFNGTEIIITLIILFSAFRHGFIKS